MTSAIRWLTSSIVAQVAVLTVGGFAALFVAAFALVLTPSLEWVFPRALSDNSASIAELVWLIENSPAELEPFILSAYRGGGRTVAITGEFSAGLQARPKLRERLEQGHSDVAARLQGRDIRFGTASFLELPRLFEPEALQSVSAASAHVVAVRLEDGRVLSFALPPSSMLARGLAGALLGGLGLLFFALALSLALASVMLRPIRNLERDAERVGLAETTSIISETGPIELRRIVRALNRMRARLGGLIREREQIVAAIAHDVRTGLTRLRLRLDAHEHVAAELEPDLRQMELLITDMLAYARAESPAASRELIGLHAFIVSLAEQSPIALDVQAPPLTEDFVIAGDRVALRRLFENLVENARRYGDGEIRLVAGPTEDGFEVCVEDNGPGLPEDKLEEVFEPFRRLETSRSRVTGGSGMGLGIARAIARAHGATITLHNRSEGGLAARVWFSKALRT
jgi:signal transduction histidine kinase